MSNPFHFKQFSVLQNNAPFKVGTDGVLLGAWVCKKSPSRILDIGTGTGLIALMLAQRFSDAPIDAIEINNLAIEQAKVNFSNSPWSNRIFPIHKSLQEFEPPEKYDMIVCNPPFFKNSLLSVDQAKNQARHDEGLTLQDVLDFSKQYLSDTGALSLVLPKDRQADMVNLIPQFDHYFSWICEVYPTPNSPVKRILIELRKSNRDLRRDKLIIEEGGRHQYTPEFRALTADFYLNH